MGNSDITMKIIELTEYKTKLIPRHDEIIDLIQNKYNKQIELNIKRTKKGDQIALTSLGWVGFIPLNSNFAIKINPKVSIQNLFAMLNYVFDLKSFYFLDGIAQSESLTDFCDRLVVSLTEKIINRRKKGLYATYFNEETQLTTIKGKINLKKTIQKPYNIKLNCQYQNRTNDIEENQILLWTLNCLTRCKIFNNDRHSLIRKAYHGLQHSITLKPFKPQECINRQYNRLNQDYKIMHLICFFFLQHISPTHHQGEENTLPFLVNMAQLYEKFVAQWLKTHLPAYLKLKIHEEIRINEDLKFNIDLVIYDQETGKSCYILDTKYKTKFNPTDFHQIVSYTTQKNCKNAVLIYPQNLKNSFNIMSGDINIRTLTFSLDGDLEVAGKIFLENLIN
jgi:5-methylcytosine-specific restriction enzyme subunit McrC